MSETQPLPPPIEATTPPPTSLGAKLFNVFATPGEVFAEVKNAPASAANWLVPAIISAVIGVIYVLVIFSQPAIQHQMRDAQDKAMEQRVKDGKMTAAQKEQAEAIMEKFSGVIKITGAVGAIASSFVRILWWGFVLWGLGRWVLKSRLPYMKAVEVAGLGMMIPALGAVVTLLLVISQGSMYATPSLAFLVDDFDLNNKRHVLLAATNIFNFWLVGVMAVGLAKLSGAKLGRAALTLATFWLALELVFVFTGLGQFAM